MHGRSTPAIRALSTALLALTLTGTAVGAAAPKEGNGPEPVMLDLAVGAYTAGRPVDLFRSKVAELSDGQLEIRATTTSSLYESGIAEQVLSGEADLGYVFARGLDGLGARGFQALLAPFVATDAELQRAVATGPVGADILAELSDHGLEGLTIVPGGQRFVVGLDRPFVSLDDFAGATVNVPETAANFALIRALGAEPSGVGWSTIEELEAAGVDAVITSIASVGYPGWTLTSNLAVQAVPDVLFANADTMAELSPEHREIVHAAAQAVQDALLEDFVAIESTTLPCVAGARIVAASDQDLAAIIEAVQPVIDEMASDPVTAAFLDRIAMLRAETVPAPLPASCDGGTPPEVAMSSIPDGTYTATVTYEDALRTGWNDGCTSPDRTALVTLVIEGGVNWTELSACGDGPTEVGARGTFEYLGDTLVMREPGAQGQATFSWSAYDSGLTLRLLENDPQYAPAEALLWIFEHEFTRVSPAAAMSSIPDGTYTATVTHEDALRTGFNDGCTSPDRNALVTLVIEGSNFTEIQQCGDGAPEVGSEGTFEYDGEVLVMRSPGTPGGATFAWSADGSGFTLEFVGTDDGAAWPAEVMRFMFEHAFMRTSS